MAVATDPYSYQVVAVGDLIAAVRRRHRCGDRFRHGVDESIQREWNRWRRQRFSNRRQRAKVHDDRCQVLVGHVLVLGIRHHRKERTTIVADALADGARELIVGPRACAGFAVRCNVGSGQKRQPFVGPRPTAPLRTGLHRETGPVKL